MAKYLGVVMKNCRSSQFLKAIVSVFLLFGFTCIYAQFAGGSGTVEDPYQVASAEHLNNIRNYLGNHFVQIADINLETPPYNTGEGWAPIGLYVDESSTANQPFTGSYDGGGFRIYNLFIHRPATSGVGLFAYARYAVLNNITLERCNVRGGFRTAALTAYAYSVDFTNCQVTGYVYGGSSSGGMIGRSKNANVTDCNARCYVTAGMDIGGLIGYAEFSNITNCYSRRSVSGSAWVGGLVGYAPDSVINDCFSSADVTAVAKSCGGLVASGWRLVINRSYALGNVNGHDDCGGLAGHLDDVTINNCFARGNVTASDHHAGGLVGYDCVSTDIYNSYSTGFVSTPWGAGGLVGGTTGSTTTVNCYWDMITSGQNTSAGGIGRTTEQMVWPYDQETYAVWDFQDIWMHDADFSLNDGYPIFNYMIPVSNEDEVIPAALSATMSNYPNPFRESTTISFDIPKSSGVTLSIYNSKGQLVRTLTDGQYAKGRAHPHLGRQE
jgi:hypothetical protein